MGDLTTVSGRNTKKSGLEFSIFELSNVKNCLRSLCTCSLGSGSTFRVFQTGHGRPDRGLEAATHIVLHPTMGVLSQHPSFCHSPGVPQGPSTVENTV